MKRLLRVLLWFFLFLVAVVLLLPSLGSGFYMGIWSMAFGWLEFLKRVGPQVTVNWSGLGMVVVCSTLIVAGLHHLCTWLYRHRLGHEVTGNNSWRWQWSLSLYALLWLLFLAAIGVTGFVHQLSWLMTSKEPWAVKREHGGMLRSELRNAAFEIQRVGEVAGWDIPTTQKSFFESEIPFSRQGVVLQEELHVIFIPDSSNKLAAGIVFHRNPAKREKAGFVVVERAGRQEYEEKNFAELSSVLARYGR